MNPGDTIIRRSAYRHRETFAPAVEHVDRVTPTGRIRLRSGVLDSADYWRLATPAEIAAYEARRDLERLATSVKAHLDAAPTVRTWGAVSPRDVAALADAAMEWSDKLRALRADLARAVAAADAALEACQPPPRGEP